MINLSLMCADLQSSLPNLKFKLFWKRCYTMLLRMRAIISRGLYIFNPISKDHFFLFKELFQKILSLCMACIQERLLIKSGLWWRAYGISSPHEREKLCVKSSMKSLPFEKNQLKTLDCYFLLDKTLAFQTILNSQFLGIECEGNYISKSCSRQLFIVGS